MFVGTAEERQHLGCAILSMKIFHFNHGSNICCSAIWILFIGMRHLRQKFIINFNIIGRSREQQFATLGAAVFVFEMCVILATVRSN
jgi:hypothetical protein